MIGGSRFRLLLVVLPIVACGLLWVALPAGTQEVVGTRSDSCLKCHEEMGGKYLKLVQDFKNSKHWEYGLGCIDCHGGDSTSNDVAVAMDPAIGFIGKPDRAIVIELCGKCHSDAAYMKKFSSMRTDQVELYKTSVHGKRFFEDGDTKVAVCIDCHSGHLITDSHNPTSSTNKANIPQTCGKCHADGALMSLYGISSTIPSDYMAGWHGQLFFDKKEIAAPVCTDCHGYHGAAPPGVESIHLVCGSCHLRTEQFYAQGAHNEAFKSKGLPRCITCHDNHKLVRPDDSLFLSKSKGGCLVCRSEGTAEYAVIQEMSSTNKEIQGFYDDAVQLVIETEKTTHLSMGEMTPKVEAVRTKLLTARVMQHAADKTLIEGNLTEAKTAFDEIQKFTLNLIDRGKSAKRKVLLLGGFLFFYGLVMLYYTKIVLANR